MKIPTFVLAAFVSIFGLGFLPTLDASVMDRKTIVTFGERVEIPTMILEPGMYVIKRPNGMMSPDVVQFLNGDETHVFATVFALPVYRDKPSDKVEFIFEERPAGAPQALKEWFYPGNIVGSEFVYPKDRQLLASVTQLQPSWSAEEEDASDAQTYPSTTAEASEAEPSQETEPARDEEVEIAQATPPPAPGSYAQAPAARQEPTTSAPALEQEQQPQAGEELPQTASSLPLSGLLGALAIGLGVALRGLSRRLA